MGHRRFTEAQLKTKLREIGEQIDRDKAWGYTTPFYKCPLCSNTGLVMEIRPNAEGIPIAWSKPCHACTYGEDAKASWDKWSRSVKEKAIPAPNKPLVPLGDNAYEDDDELPF